MTNWKDSSDLLSYRAFQGATKAEALENFGPHWRSAFQVTNALTSLSKSSTLRGILVLTMEQGDLDNIANQVDEVDALIAELAALASMIEEGGSTDAAHQRKVRWIRMQVVVSILEHPVLLSIGKELDVTPAEEIMRRERDRLARTIKARTLLRDITECLSDDHDRAQMYLGMPTTPESDVARSISRTGIAKIVEDADIGIEDFGDLPELANEFRDLDREWYRLRNTKSKRSTKVLATQLANVAEQIATHPVLLDALSQAEHLGALEPVIERKDTLSESIARLNEFRRIMAEYRSHVTRHASACELRVIRAQSDQQVSNFLYSEEVRLIGSLVDDLDFIGLTYQAGLRDIDFGDLPEYFDEYSRTDRRLLPIRRRGGLVEDDRLAPAVEELYRLAIRILVHNGMTKLSAAIGEMEDVNVLYDQRNQLARYDFENDPYELPERFRQYCDPSVAAVQPRTTGDDSDFSSPSRLETETMLLAIDLARNNSLMDMASKHESQNLVAQLEDFRRLDQQLTPLRLKGMLREDDPLVDQMFEDATEILESRDLAKVMDSFQRPDDWESARLKWIHLGVMIASREDLIRFDDQYRDYRAGLLDRSARGSEEQAESSTGSPVDASDVRLYGEREEMHAEMEQSSREYLESVARLRESGSLSDEELGLLIQRNPYREEGRSLPVASRVGARTVDVGARSVDKRDVGKSSKSGELTLGERADLEKARSKATASMVLGIIGIVLFGFLALIAVPLGHSAKKTFIRHPMHAHAFGAGRATAGVILGWIVIGLWAIGWMVIIGALTAAS